MQDEASQQWGDYISTYQPMEQQYAQEAQNWASPQAIAQGRGEAMADVGEQGMAGVNTAAETLKAYGVNPGSPKFAGLYTSTQPMIGAAEAAAGTTAAQNLRLQGMGLQAGAINTGRGLVNATGSLTGEGTGAGSAASGSASGAGQTAFGDLSGTAVGAGATSELFNAGTGAMNSYVGAVNGYNNSQAAFAQANATEMAGIGSAIGGVAGLGLGKFMHAEAGRSTSSPTVPRAYWCMTMKWSLPIRSIRLIRAAALRVYPAPPCPLRKRHPARHRERFLPMLRREEGCQPMRPQVTAKRPTTCQRC